MTAAAASLFITTDYLSAPMKVSVYSTNTGLVANSPYTVTITGTIISRYGNIMTSTLLIPLAIKGLNNGPPYFSPILKTINVDAGGTAK